MSIDANSTGRPDSRIMDVMATPPRYPPPPLPIANPPIPSSDSMTEYMAWHAEHFAQGHTVPACIGCTAIANALSGNEAADGSQAATLVLRALAITNVNSQLSANLDDARNELTAKIRMISTLRSEAESLDQSIATLAFKEQAEIEETRKATKALKETVHCLAMWRRYIPGTVRQQYLGDPKFSKGEGVAPKSFTRQTIPPPAQNVWEWEKCVDYLSQEWMEDRLPPGIRVSVTRSLEDGEVDLHFDGVAIRGWLLFHHFADWNTDKTTFCAAISLALEDNGYRELRTRHQLQINPGNTINLERHQLIEVNDALGVARHLAEAGVEDEVVWDAIHYARLFAEDFWEANPNTMPRPADLETRLARAKAIDGDKPNVDGVAQRVQPVWWFSRRVWASRRKDGGRATVGPIRVEKGQDEGYGAGPSRQRVSNRSTNAPYKKHQVTERSQRFRQTMAPGNMRSSPIPAFQIRALSSNMYSPYRD